MKEISIYKRLWNSTTITTWMSFLSKSFNVTLIMPLILSRFDTNDVNLWYLTASMISMQILLDAGFGSAFVRIIAYGTVGLKSFSELRTGTISCSNGKFDEGYIASSYRIMQRIYRYLSIIALVFLGSFGSWLIEDAVNLSTNAVMGWYTWSLFVLTFPIILWGNVYMNLLQGTKNVALVRRWDTLFNSFNTASIVLLLLIYPNVYILIIINQLWMIIATLRNAYLVKNRYPFLSEPFSDEALEAEISKNAIPSALKSGLGILMSQGIIQSSAFVFAKLASANDLASYLIGLTLIQNLRNFAQAPFYSKLPELATYTGKGDIKGLSKIAAKNMNLVYYIYILGFLLLAYFHSPFFSLINSNVRFPNPVLWNLLGLAFLIDRFGAMHLQVYSTTNHIIWHYLNGITGALMIIFAILLFPLLKIYSFPIAMILAYLLCYSWYAPYKSYQLVKSNFLAFEKNGFIPCALIIILNLLLNNQNF